MQAQKLGNGGACQVEKPSPIDCVTIFVMLLPFLFIADCYFATSNYNLFYCFYLFTTLNNNEFLQQNPLSYHTPFLVHTKICTVLYIQYCTLQYSARLRYDAVSYVKYKSHHPSPPLMTMVPFYDNVTLKVDSYNTLFLDVPSNFGSSANLPLLSFHCFIIIIILLLF